MVDGFEGGALHGFFKEFGSGSYVQCFIENLFPDPQEDLESRSPNLGPYTTKGTL